jgi:hypothetical protein
MNYPNASPPPNASLYTPEELEIRNNYWKEFLRMCDRLSDHPECEGMTDAEDYAAYLAD